jgi:alpha-glucosidase (family GH31 glycosyl hydrolase)
VWPGPTVFPDFLHPHAEEWWAAQYQAFHRMVGFDGSWIDMVGEGREGCVCVCVRWSLEEEAGVC